VTRPTFIMLHHSGTPDGATLNWQAMRRYHVDTRHWTDIGYHAGVELVRDEFEALYGRPLDAPAAACPAGDMNTRALHVCLVGNFDLAPPGEGALAVLVRRVLLPWIRMFEIPVEHVVGHRDYASTRCPGLQLDLDELRARLR